MASGSTICKGPGGSGLLPPAENQGLPAPPTPDHPTLDHPSTYAKPAASTPQAAGQHQLTPHPADRRGSPARVQRPGRSRPAGGLRGTRANGLRPQDSGTWSGPSCQLGGGSPRTRPDPSAGSHPCRRPGQHREEGLCPDTHRLAEGDGTSQAGAPAQDVTFCTSSPVAPRAHGDPHGCDANAALPRVAGEAWCSPEGTGDTARAAARPRSRVDAEAPGAHAFPSQLGTPVGEGQGALLVQRRGGLRHTEGPLLPFLHPLAAPTEFSPVAREAAGRMGKAESPRSSLPCGYPGPHSGRNDRCPSEVPTAAPAPSAQLPRGRTVPRAGRWAGLEGELPPEARRLRASPPHESGPAACKCRFCVSVEMDETALGPHTWTGLERGPRCAPQGPDEEGSARAKVRAPGAAAGGGGFLHRPASRAALGLLRAAARGRPLRGPQQSRVALQVPGERENSPAGPLPGQFHCGARTAEGPLLDPRRVLLSPRSLPVLLGLDSLRVSPGSRTGPSLALPGLGLTVRPGSCPVSLATLPPPKTARLLNGWCLPLRSGRDCPGSASPSTRLSTTKGTLLPSARAAPRQRAGEGRGDAARKQSGRTATAALAQPRPELQAEPEPRSPSKAGAAPTPAPRSGDSSGGHRVVGARAVGEPGGGAVPGAGLRLPALRPGESALPPARGPGRSGPDPPNPGDEAKNRAQTGSPLVAALELAGRRGPPPSRRPLPTPAPQGRRVQGAGDSAACPRLGPPAPAPPAGTSIPAGSRHHVRARGCKLPHNSPLLLQPEDIDSEEKQWHE
ncbi:collagen alpha-1(I) chain-like [Hyaena hyaena]|uniref:collagen alpha-1(I) chain-like n=1 Tax=Hyaena hyaena TaxID=95912 RepID=UPI001920ACDB|nr:collagen alpha-1(I) chain-like [Hyaena hyaena]